MNLSMNWLSDFVNVGSIDIKDYCNRMTDTGSKVEGYEIIGQDIENVLVGKIEKITKHENSDHLQICMLNMGNGELLQIVTGAQNVFEGAIVPVAVAPAKLPGGPIKAGKLRGVASNGMLCSIGELGLTTHDCPGAVEDGIYILGEEFEDRLGCDIRDVLMLKDTVVEFEITSNRPDCLSVIGLARESSASFGTPLFLHTPKVKASDSEDKIENYLSVKNEANDLCSRYTARVVKNIRIAPSPLWMRARLRASGVRPINNIVDITNYVMLEYGQPMHAFDYKCLDGSAITVRRARDGEVFMSLDDKEHKLDSKDLVISDDKKAVALAGVMGGANSEITENTKTVVFESACFDGASVRVTAKKQAMRTESSARFEKGLDPENTLPAIERACELIEMLGAGEVVPGIIDVYPTKKETRYLPLNAEKINSFLGVDLSEEYMISVLESLDIPVSDGMIKVPSFRDDLLCMNDIAEEIIRIYGYNKIESSSIMTKMIQGGRTERQAFELKIDSLMTGMGFDEIQTFSFISPKYYDKIRLPKDSALRNSIVISNPLGEDTSIMRTTAIPSIMEILTLNFNFSNENVSLYELATVYIPRGENELPDERTSLVIGMYGDTDFYKLKGICENIFKLAGLGKITYTAEKGNDTFHPGRCAIASVGGTKLATFGQIHPSTAANYGIDTAVYVAEIDIEEVFANYNGTKSYKALPKYPATARDFSFICDEALEVGTIYDVMEKAGGKLVESVSVFDIYRGAQIGEGKKSVSIRTVLRAADRTLTVEEADKVSQKILKALGEELNLSLRG